MYHVLCIHGSNKSNTPTPRGAANAQVLAKAYSQIRMKAKPFQVLVRLPEDLASRFVQVVKPGQRNSYFLELLRRELDRESDELAQTAQALTELEARDDKLREEDSAWMNSTLLDSNGDFEAAEFERQFRVVQKEREAATRAVKATVNNRAARKV